MKKSRLLCLLIVILFSGCGFQLRSYCQLPSAYQTLAIQPNTPFDPFQRVLRNALETQGVCITDSVCDNKIQKTILTISSQTFTERTLLYGSDVQVNRVVLQFTVMYQVTDHQGQLMIPNGLVRVERELTVLPNAVLGTENERNRIQQELYLDASSQLLRQLSAPHANSGE